MTKSDHHLLRRHACPEDNVPSYDPPPYSPPIISDSTSTLWPHGRYHRRSVEYTREEKAELIGSMRIFLEETWSPERLRQHDLLRVLRQKHRSECSHLSEKVVRSESLREEKLRVERADMSATQTDRCAETAVLSLALGKLHTFTEVVRKANIQLAGTFPETARAKVSKVFGAMLPHSARWKSQTIFDIWRWLSSRNVPARRKSRDFSRPVDAEELKKALELLQNAQQQIYHGH